MGTPAFVAGERPIGGDCNRAEGKLIHKSRRGDMERGLLRPVLNI